MLLCCTFVRYSPIRYISAVCNRTFSTKIVRRFVRPPPNFVHQYIRAQKYEKSTAFNPLICKYKHPSLYECTLFFYFITHKKNKIYRNCFTWNIIFCFSIHYPQIIAYGRTVRIALPLAPSLVGFCPLCRCAGHGCTPCPILIPWGARGQRLRHRRSVANSSAECLSTPLTLPTFACIMARFCVYAYADTYI